jgi:hypothetical protein
MTWARLDDLFPTHRKIRRLSHAAFRLHVSAICWCNLNLTDGFIPAEELRHVADVTAPKKYATELVDAGVWDLTDDGWMIHDFLEYQPSAQKVHAERDAKKKRQERWLAKKKASRDVDRDASVDASGDGSKDDAPSPHPPRPEGSGGGCAPERKAGAAGRANPKGSPVRAIPTWCGTCDERTRQLETDDGRPARCPTCHPLGDDRKELA